MTDTTDLTGAGRPEAVWRAWSAPTTWPRLDVPAGVRAVVVSAHPDDDVLAVGGLLRRWGDAGGRLRCVLATDGEASHPRSPTTTPGQLAARRAAEADAAYVALGVAPTVVRLGLPDGRVADHEDHLAARLAAVIRPDDLLVAPWPSDGHPDHDAVGRAAAVAAAAVGAARWSYPVWAWHWATPSVLERRWSSPRRVDLPAAVRTAKARAIDAHASQVVALSPAAGDEPVVPPHVRARFERGWEVVLT